MGWASDQEKRGQLAQKSAAIGGLALQWAAESNTVIL